MTIMRVEYLILLLSLTFPLSNARTCPRDMYLEGSICKECGIGCHTCDEITSECIICDVYFYELNGSCFHECEFPLLAYVQEDKTIECRHIPVQDFAISNEVLSDYNSENGIFSTYFDFNSNPQQELELSFWIKFKEVELGEEIQNFFVLTTLKTPFPEFVVKPSLLKFGLHGDKLIGPTQVTSFNMKTFFNQWMFLSMFMVFPAFKENLMELGIVFMSLEDENLVHPFNYVKYPSNWFYADKFILHVGHLSKQGDFSFNIKNLDIRFQIFDQYLGHLIYFLNKQKTTVYHEEINPVFNSQSLDHKEYKLYEITFIKSFEYYIIRTTIAISFLNFPQKILEFRVDDEILLNLDLIRIEESIFININQKYNIKIESSKIILDLFLFATEDQIMAHIHEYRLKLPFSGMKKFRLLVYEDKSQDIELISISKSPSIFFSYLSEMSDCTNLMCNNFISGSSSKAEICPRDRNKLFFFSMEECDQDYDIRCKTKIKNCKHCLTIQFCLICELDYYLLDGNCYSECPENFYPSIKNNISYCKFCEPYEEYLDSNLECQNCPLYFQNKDQNCDEVVQKFMDLNCSLLPAIFSCLSCPEGCSDCSKKNDRVYCASCINGYYHHEGKCYQGSCPKQHYHFENSQFCSEKCNNHSFISIDGICKPCRKLDVFMKFDICQNYCPSEYYRKNDDCIKYNITSDCLLMGREYCEMESAKQFSQKILKMKGLIAEDIIHNFERPSKSYTLNIGLFTFECDAFLSKSPFGMDYGYCVREQKNNSIEQQDPIDNQIEETSYDCNLLLDSVYTIKFNNSCIIIPNSHFHQLRKTQFLNVHEYIKGVNFSNFSTNLIDLGQIQLCDQISFNEENSTCLVKCPIKFYRDKLSICRKCPDDCYRCRFENEILTCLNKSKLLFDQKPGISYSTALPSQNLNILDYNFKFIYYSSLQCPNGCKKCYNYGPKFVCLECENLNMKISRKTYLCECINDLLFDHKTKMCLESCRPESLSLDNECVEDCNQITSKSNDMLKYIQVIRHNNMCLHTCPSRYYPTRNVGFSDEINCRTNYILNDVIDCDEKIEVEKLYDEILEKGYFMIRNIFKLCLKINFIHFLEKMLEKDTGDQATIISMIPFLLESGTEFDEIGNMTLGIIDKVLKNPHSNKVIFRASYVSRVISPRQLLKDFVLIQSEIFSNDSDFNFPFHENSEFKIALNLKEKFREPLFFTRQSTKKPSYEILSFDLRENLEISIYSNEIGSFKISSTENERFKDFFISVVNLTHKIPSQLKLNESYLIKTNSLYFIMISQFQVNEEIEIIFEEQLIFGRGKINKTTETFSDRVGTHSLTKSVELFVYITAVVLVIVAFVWFLRNKIFEASKFKFVQMVEMEDDEDLEDENKNNFE